MIQHKAILVEGVKGALSQGSATMSDLRQAVLRGQEIPADAKLSLESSTFSFQQNLVATWESE